MKKPGRYCAAFPCRSLSEEGSAYCALHRPSPAPKTADAFYLSARWRRFRNWYIAKNPLCEHCLAEGLVEKATIVDHVVELRDGGDRLSEDNAQSLCAACHNRKSAREMVKRKGRLYVY